MFLQVRHTGQESLILVVLLKGKKSLYIRGKVRKSNYCWSDGGRERVLKGSVCEGLVGEPAGPRRSRSGGSSGGLCGG